jgi:hypothetical protein
VPVCRCTSAPFVVVKLTSVRHVPLTAMLAPVCRERGSMRLKCRAIEVAKLAYLQRCGERVVGRCQRYGQATAPFPFDNCDQRTQATHDARKPASATAIDNGWHETEARRLVRTCEVQLAGIKGRAFPNSVSL